MKKLLTLFFIAALLGVTAPFAEAKTTVEAAEIVQQRREQRQERREERRERRSDRRENRRYDRNRRDNRYYQNRRHNNRRYQTRRYNSRVRTAYRTRNVRRGNRFYRETYRITYSPNGRTNTRLVSRTRVRY